MGCLDAGKNGLWSLFLHFAWLLVGSGGLSRYNIYHIANVHRKNLMCENWCNHAYIHLCIWNHIWEVPFLICFVHIFSLGHGLGCGIRWFDGIFQLKAISLSQVPEIESKSAPAKLVVKRDKPFPFGQKASLVARNYRLTVWHVSLGKKLWWISFQVWRSPSSPSS